MYLVNAKPLAETNSYSHRETEIVDHFNNNVVNKMLSSTHPQKIRQSIRQYPIN